MNLEFAKFKILCINIFLILLKATTLNPYKLLQQLREVDYTLQSNCDLCHSLLVVIISLYLEIKFVMGYITLAANVVALFPILADDLPNLLLPALIAQSIDHIALNFSELVVGLCTMKLLAAYNMGVFVIFVLSKLMLIAFAIAALNIYSDYYQQMKFFNRQLELSESFISQEKFIRSQSLHQRSN